MRNPYHIYIATYFTLEYVFENQVTKGVALSHYLGEANPFIWTDKGSADPAIWIEFEQAFDKRFPSGETTDEESLAFVRDYLSKQGPYYIRVFPGGDETPFLDLFDAETDLSEWTRMLDDLERQDRERE